MITKRGMFILLVAGICYLAEPILDVRGFMEACGILLAVTAMGFVSCWLGGFGLECRLECDPEAVAGSETHPRLTVVNRLPIPRYGLTARLTFPPAGAAGAFLWVWLPRLPALGETTLYLRATCRERGRFQVGPVAVFVRDPLGLFCRQRVFPCQAEVCVLPPHVRLDGFPFLEGGAGFRDPQKTLPTPGFSNEFYALRPYLHGDSPRWIHWLSSARRQELMTQQFQAPIQRRVLIVLDCIRPFWPRLGRWERFEEAVAVTASVIVYAAETDYEFGLYEAGRQQASGELGSGQEPMRRGLTQLAGAKPDGSRQAAALAGLVAAPAPALLVVTVDPSPDLVEILLGLQRRGRNVSVVLVGPGKRSPRSPAAELLRRGIPVCRVHSLARLKEDLERHPVELPPLPLSRPAKSRPKGRAKSRRRANAEARP